MSIISNSTRSLLLLLGVLVLTSFRKDIDKPLLGIKARFEKFTIDNIGNMYLVQDEEIVKVLPTGKPFARYSNLKLGKITAVDATNPLKVLLYYKDFQQIVFLDNQLSVNSDEVSLTDLGYEQTELVCAGANNSFWIYNKQNNELLRFNENSKKISATGNLKQILRTELNPDFMIEHNGFLYLNSPENGIYVFDFYGAFSRVLPLTAIKQFQVDDEIVYYTKDSLLCSYNTKLMETACDTVFNQAKYLSARYFRNKLYVAYHDSLLVYQYSKK
ncbi:MAG TPA: hypothetical protein PLQ93_05765 [Bacteroidia bacterium]|nr:hypothetical protein [Bacteroidia bacterium]